MQSKTNLSLGMFLICALLTATDGSAALKISEEKAQALGLLIWKNECEGTEKGLTSWNQGEDCASLGIGHFIWYPEAHQKKYEEMFPALLKFLEEKGVSLPKWLKNAKSCPWKSREDFYLHISSPQMVQLRKLLAETTALQAAFIAQRLENALPNMLKILPDEKKIHVAAAYNKMLATPQGMYALVDYLNFKGEGIAPAEHYNGQGWGLLQVLLEVSVEQEDTLKEFAKAAKTVLERRVKNAPPDRHEHRWLKGWFKRIDTYTS